MRTRAQLVPEKMTDQQLWTRAFGLVANCHFEQCPTVNEREAYLDELSLVMMELRLRGTQLRMPS